MDGLTWLDWLPLDAHRSRFLIIVIKNSCFQKPSQQKTPLAGGGENEHSKLLCMRDYGGEMDNGMKGVSSYRILNTHFVGFEIREKKANMADLWLVRGLSGPIYDIG